MLTQNITAVPVLQEPSNERTAREGIVVPLELAEFHILRQEVQRDGSIEVEVIGINERACCPHCGRICVKVHDTRLRRKRDRSLRDHAVVLVVHKRRFKCWSCRRNFTEPDQACGRYRRTTVRLREHIGQQARLQPIAHVAKAFEVGPRFVQACLETVAEPELAKRGLSVQESEKLPTPRYLGIDEYARRKGHRYDTILCDLEGRKVLEVSAGRKKEEVVSLLERLDKCEAVEAVSMDMSSPFREAVQLCLPHARIVADHFHVIQHVGKALNKVIGRCAKKEPGKQAEDGPTASVLAQSGTPVGRGRTEPSHLSCSLSRDRRRLAPQGSFTHLVCHRFGHDCPSRLGCLDCLRQRRWPGGDAQSSLRLS